MDDKEKTEETALPPKRTKMIPVRIIRTENKSQLVEWLDGESPKRVIVSTGKVKNGKVDEAVLGKAPHYGVPWDEFKKDGLDTEMLKRRLQESGIWTYEELMAKPQEVSMILLSAIGSTRNDLVAFAKKFAKKK